MSHLRNIYSSSLLSFYHFCRVNSIVNGRSVTANDKDFRDSIIGNDTPADRQYEARNRAVMDEYVISCLKSYEDMIVSGAVSDILHPRAVSST